MLSHPVCQPFVDSVTDVVAEIGTTSVSADFAGDQTQYAGLDQVNFEIPSALAGTGLSTLTLAVDGVAANPVVIDFQ